MRTPKEIRERIEELEEVAQVAIANIKKFNEMNLMYRKIKATESLKKVQREIEIFKWCLNEETP